MPEKKLSHFGSFISLRSGEGLTSNKNNRAKFSGEKKYSVTFRTRLSLRGQNLSQISIVLESKGLL